MSATRHPREPDWANVELPDTWPDFIRWKNPLSVARLVWRMTAARRPVSVPNELWGRETIPPYVLQEFHNLPNGNYSNNLTRGYIAGFDISMLGLLRDVRRDIAARLGGCVSVLDIGCGGGATAAAVRASGVADVWGLDPSPYLLRHAAQDHPSIHFVHGVMEDLPFPPGRFDGACVCFALHEVPPASARSALREIARILRPDGLLVVAEPSPVQFHTTFLPMVRRYGWRGGYFRMLVRLVHEPFLDSWHRFALAEEARAVGFDVVEEHDSLPVRRWLFRRCAEPARPV